MHDSNQINTTRRSACLRLDGDLDYETTNDFVEAVSRLLAVEVGLADLHLDFNGLTFVDSAALSGLLIIHSRASQSGVELHLDHRPRFLDRVLQVTGLFSHFDLSHAPADDADLVARTSSR